MMHEPELSTPQISHNGKHAAWHSTGTGSPAVHVAPLDGTGYRPLLPGVLTQHQTRVFCWAEDNGAVWIQAGNPLRKVSLSNEVVATVDPQEPARLWGCSSDGIVYDNRSRGNAESGNLILLDPETGQREQLTDHAQGHQQVAVHPDGRIGYLPTGQNKGQPDANPLPTMVLDASGSGTELGGRYQPIDWLDDKLLLSADDRDDDVGIWDRRGGIQWIGSGQPLGFLGAATVLALRDGAVIELPGETSVDIGERSIATGAARHGRALLMTRETDEDPRWAIGWDGETTIQIETPEFGVAPADLITPTTETYEGSAGEARETVTLLPEEPGAPCLVHLYGHFPEAGDFDRKFGRELRYLREQGYASLLPAHGGPWGNSDRRHADYAAVGRWASEQPWANGEVIAIGHSSGGYDVLMQATQYPDAWTAGIAWSSIVDRRAFYEQFEKDRSWMKNEIEDGGLERLDEMSPINYVADAGIPLLMIQGAKEDFQSETREFVDQVRSHGVDIEYFEPARIGHWTKDLGIKVHIWATIETYLEGTLPSRRSELVSPR